MRRDPALNRERTSARGVSHLFLSIAVPVPALDLLTYRVTETGVAPPVGARVLVPLGTRSVTGIVVSHTATLPTGVAPGSVAGVMVAMAVMMMVAMRFGGSFGDAPSDQKSCGEKRERPAISLRRISCCVHITSSLG